MAARVYVIELAPEAGPRRDPRLPWVYVGSSARDPELRFVQHRRGYKAARLVRRFGRRLRPDLYDDLDSLRSAGAAREAEVQRARELARCGFVAHCDGISHGRDEPVWQEWSAERLACVSEHVDAAARELCESAFEPLDPDLCARLLRGERGFWVDRLLDPLDPPPGYGLFPHVQRSALSERVARFGCAAPAAPNRSARARARDRTGSALR